MSALACCFPAFMRPNDAGSTQGCSMAGEHPTAQLGPWVLNYCCFKDSIFGPLDCTCYPDSGTQAADRGASPRVPFLKGMMFLYSLHFTMSCSAFLKSFNVFLNYFQIYLFSQTQKKNSFQKKWNSLLYTLESTLSNVPPS